MPRILVAGTTEAIEALRELLRDDAELVLARSVREALDLFDPQIDLVVCNVRFDESRMFDFVLALRQKPGGSEVGVVSFRVEGAELSPRMRSSIRAALDALGVHTFVDVPHLALEYGRSTALETLRQIILRAAKAVP
jgi:CheY-like chemotaxis protein